MWKQGKLLPSLLVAAAFIFLLASLGRWDPEPKILSQPSSQKPYVNPYGYGEPDPEGYNEPTSTSSALSSATSESLQCSAAPITVTTTSTSIATTTTTEYATPSSTDGVALSPKSRYAIVTSVWSPSYASLALMLGWSIRKHNVLNDTSSQIDMILLTLPLSYDLVPPESGIPANATSGEKPKEPLVGQFTGLTVDNRTRLEHVGWAITDIEELENPNIDKSAIASHRQNNLNKLHAWNMTSYEKILWLDADTVVKGSITDLFNLPGEFAAAPDSWHDVPIDTRINSGVMVLKPSMSVFLDMREKIGSKKWFQPEQGDGDQAFLQRYFEYRDLKLPLVFNLNLINYVFHRPMWDSLWKSTIVLHFTVRKPSPDPAQHCVKPNEGQKDGCAEWFPLEWYKEYFNEMRKELGWMDDIPLLG